MTETFFQIISHAPNPPTNPSKDPYTQMLEEFSARNYGHYTETFISRMEEEACTANFQFRKINMKKTLRQIILQFMLVDLQIVFLAYYCRKSGWDLLTASGSNMSSDHSNDDQIRQNIYSYLCNYAYFVKSYVGEQTQFAELSKHLQKRDRKFQTRYEKWVGSFPDDHFCLSPQALNLIYREYSRNCQIVEQKKNYNDLVDQIIELSATYSIIPASQNEGGVKPAPRTRKAVLARASEISLRAIKQESMMKCQDSQIVQEYKGRQLSIDKPQPLKSREKKSCHTTKKISLNLKKNEQPNNPVLDYMRQQRNKQQENAMNIKGEESVNKSFMEINLPDNPPQSWLDFRGSRSSGGSNGISMFWKQSDGNFFEKSRLN